MPSQKNLRATSVKALEKARTDHKKLVKKVEAARRKVQKRSRKLRKLEVRIAELERRASHLSPPNGREQLNGTGVMTAQLIYNPKSGASAKEKSLEEIIELLAAHGIRAKVGIKTSGKAARELACEAVAKNQELVIVAAGDGTIEEVASQLVGTQTALGILPLGTMNNLARSLGIPLNLEDACALLGTGITRQIDVGRVVANEKPQVEYFLESAGLGLTALALPAGQALRKRQLDKLPGAIRKMFEMKPGPVQVELDTGEIIQAHSELVTVSNAPLIGSNFLIAPEARMDDGLLDVAVYDGMSKTELIGYFLGTGNGKRVYDPRVRFYRARKVRIHSEQATPVVSDKDEIPDKQVLDIEILPQALKLVVGKGVALNLPVEAVQSVPPLSGPQPVVSNGNGAAKQSQSVDEQAQKASPQPVA